MTPDFPPPFDNIWVRFIIGFILGSIFGSFFTALAYRVPRGLSMITPRSHCPSCKTTLGFRDLIPLFSWLTSAGKCRHCGISIGLRYFSIELSFSLCGGLLVAFLPFLFT